MRILVIGGNGFIGKPLVRQLMEGGHRVAGHSCGGFYSGRSAYSRPGTTIESRNRSLIF
jgi:nucleoside-diphosphate-sugar epimerase